MKYILVAYVIHKNETLHNGGLTYSLLIPHIDSIEIWIDDKSVRDLDVIKKELKCELGLDDSDEETTILSITDLEYIN